MKKNSVLFLDRDGTINIDMGPEYLSDPAKVQLIEGAGKAIIKAKKAGFKIAIITNQAGVAKGKTPKEALPLIHKRLEAMIAEEAGVKDFAFDDIRICMHHPDDKCACRKPGVKMLEEAMEKLHADLGDSFFVGDKDTDILCANRMHIRSILVRTGHGTATEIELDGMPLAGLVGAVDSLTDAVELAIRLRDS